MVSSNWQFERVSHSRPCPICEKPDWCLVSRDGSAVICPRTEEGATKHIADSGWLHHPDDRDRFEPRPVDASPNPQRKKLIADQIEQVLLRYEQKADVGLPELALQLGLSIDVLRRLQVGYCKFENFWSFPERDAHGNVIGIQRRFAGGDKRRLPGSKSGLTFADHWDAGSGPLLLVEGATDVAAAMMLELSVIGRPSNRGGVALLGELLQSFDSDRDIIVLGERDQKNSGLWPGRDGAIHTATELAKRLNRSIHWALPPDNQKDLRAWVNHYARHEPALMKAPFLGGLDCRRIDPPPIQRMQFTKIAKLPADEYRAQMRSIRLRSLDMPGIYLDRSSTGHGKSTLDFEVIISMVSRTEVN